MLFYTSLTEGENLANNAYDFIVTPIIGDGDLKVANRGDEGMFVV